MKYAKEVIDLLGAYPGRRFRMAEIIRHISRGGPLTVRRRNAMRVGVHRVLEVLAAEGCVRQIKRGQTAAVYVWESSSKPHSELACDAR